MMHRARNQSRSWAVPTTIVSDALDTGNVGRQLRSCADMSRYNRGRRVCTRVGVVNVCNVLSEHEGQTSLMDVGIACLVIRVSWLPSPSPSRLLCPPLRCSLRTAMILATASRYPWKASATIGSERPWVAEGPAERWSIVQAPSHRRAEESAPCRT